MQNFSEANPEKTVFTIADVLGKSKSVNTNDTSDVAPIDVITNSKTIEIESIDVDEIVSIPDTTTDEDEEMPSVDEVIIKEYHELDDEIKSEIVVADHDFKVE